MENRQSNRHIKQHRIKVVRLRVWSGTQWHIMPFNFHCWWIIFSYDQHILIIPASTPLWFTQQQTSTLLIVDKYLSSWWFQPPLKKKKKLGVLDFSSQYMEKSSKPPTSYTPILASRLFEWFRSLATKLMSRGNWCMDHKSKVLCEALPNHYIYIYHHIYIMYI